MRLVPITLAEARAFVEQHHRHNRPPVGWRFGVGLVNGTEELLGVAVAGHPVARKAMDGRTLEITRVCTVGEKNANSMLYGAICRAAKALGYERAITYTLESESGASLKAAGFEVVGKTDSDGARGWSTAAGKHYEQTLWGKKTHPAEPRIKWERAL